MVDSLGLLISEKPVLRSVVFHKYSIEFPKDWDYGIIVRRLYFCCQELLNKGILSTYLVREEEKLQAWLLTHKIVDENELKSVLAKRELNLKQYEGEIELDPSRNDIP